MTNERFSRRRCLALALTGASSLRAAPENQIARLIEVYGHQGFHRTGTAIDRASAEWLASEVRRAGLRPSLESFTLSRVDTVTTALILGDRRIAGIPLFDAAFTNAEGISGRLGPLNSDAEIGLSETVPNAAAAGALGEARRKGQHKAIVCVTRGGRPGLCPSNADLFREPFGPPVLQVASEETAALRELAQQQSQVRLIAHVRRTPAQALNVVARIDGVRPVLPPVVVMTPRSGWYTCASERGGAIVCWLELMRALRNPKPLRNVIFVASSGHELGHLGINAFVDGRPGIVKSAAAWIHLGANIGAALDPGNTLQSSDAQIETQWAQAMTAAGLSIDRRNPLGTVPGGEAEAVHRGGGRYISVIGRNAMFHNPEDRGPQVVDTPAIGRFVAALTEIALKLAG